MSETPAIVVFITAADRAEAASLARLLIDARLAACVQILPEIASVYRWQGEIIEDKEILILVKTTADKFERLEKVVRANHTYDVPEILAVPAAAVSEPYLDWLNETMKSER